MNATITNSRRHLLTHDECLFFLHIPKTAGTTFTGILKNQFDLDEICPATRWLEILNLSRSEFSKYRLIAGHMTHSLHRYAPKPLVYITMLRDPVERVISQYENIRRSEPHYPYKKMFTQDISLYDFILDPELNHVATDAAVRMIGENYSLEELLQLYTVRDYDETFVNPPETTPTNELLERAKRRLERFAFFGIAERFSDSVNLLNYTLGWQPERATQELNKASKRMRREDLSQATIDAIIERNQADIELYHFAQSLFDRRYNDMVRMLLDEDYQRLYAYDSAQMDRWALNYADKIQGTGWQPPDPQTPEVRWTGPGTISTIDLPLRRDKTLQLTFRIATTLAQDILDSFRVEINRTPVSLNPEDAGGAPGIRLTALVTPEMLESDLPFTRISFHVNRTVQPRDVLPDNHDERFLGVAIADLKIAPSSG